MDSEGELQYITECERVNESGGGENIYCGRLNLWISDKRVIEGQRDCLLKVVCC